MVFMGVSFFKKSGLFPFKAEQLLQGMELLDKKGKKKKKHIGKLFRKNPKIKGVY